MKCEICGKVDVKNIGIHLSKGHKEINSKEYYDKYLKKDGEGTCFFCGGESHFYNANKGYSRKCRSNDCNKRSWASNTIESIMFKYDVDLQEAKKILKDRADNFSNSLKKAHKKILKKNPNYFKEKSHNSKEYWIKRGYSEKKALQKCKEVMDEVHIKTSKKRQENKEDYIGTIPTQLEYWLKQGYDEKTAKHKLKKRQQTFTLDKCIKKYGEIDGKKRWLERQEKWQDTLKSKSPEELERIYRAKLNGGRGYSKISQELFEEVYYRLPFEKNRYYFATLNEDRVEDDGDNNEFIVFTKRGVRFLDFYDLKTKRIIEFDGDYWHGSKGDVKRDEEREIEIKKTIDCEILHIKEKDYNEDPEGVINECLNFLRG